MKNINTTPGIGTDVNFLNGNLVDTQTLLNTTILQDIVQFFQKLKSKAGITENGLFDNEVNGYQTVEALDKRNNTSKTAIIDFQTYQSYIGSSSAPTVTVNYPYNQTFEQGRFIGFCTYKADSTERFVSFDMYTDNAPNLTTGKTLITGAEVQIKAYNYGIVITPLGAATINLLSLTIHMQLHKDFA